MSQQPQAQARPETFLYNSLTGDTAGDCNVPGECAWFRLLTAGSRSGGALFNSGWNLLLYPQVPTSDTSLWTKHMVSID